MTTDDSIKNHHDGDDENTLKNNVETELSTERPLVVTKMNPWKIPEVNTSTTASTAQSSTFHNHSANTTHGTTSPDGESILNNGFTTTKKNVISFQSIMDQQQKEEEKEKSKQKVSNNFTTQEEDEEEKMIRLAIEASLKDEEMRKQYDQQQEYIDYHHYNLVDTATDAAVADVNDEQYKEDHIQNNTIIHNMEIVHDKKNDDHDSMDEDMKFAIRLSLQEQQQQRKCRYDKDGFEILPDSINKGSTEQYHKVTGDDKEMEKNPSPSNRLTPLDQQSITAEHNDNTTGIDTTILSSVASIPTSSSLTKEEEEQIAKALMDADNEEMAKSVQLAMKLADEEEQYYKDTIKQKEPESTGESHVRIVNHYEWNDLRRQKNNSNDSSEQQNPLWGKDDYDLHQQYYNNDHKYELEDDDIDEVSGFQMNKNIPSSQWSRLDKNTIIGPNNEIRTKHDVALKNQTNAKKLLSSTSSINVKKQDGKVSVSDVAYNSFHRSLKNAMKRSTVKGVAAHGTGRAENMNAEKTRGGAMDGNVRLLISKAVTNGLIQYCNGVVKEGKEAIVYHADGNNDMDSKSRGFDVAVKVFKRIQEFKGRGAYIDGDPRYHGKKFRDIDSREQIELWTEKEYRNLVRANRAGVPVPTPILQKENVLFMRFLGNDGWPSPQLREVELKKGSKIWTALYIQTLVAVRRLYHCAKLVHSDLSEYNILVSPIHQVQNVIDKRQESKDALQIVLIDFGQAVEKRHPCAGDFLRRDLLMIKLFFDKQEIKTLSLDDAEKFVLKKIENNLGDSENRIEQENDDSNEDNYSESTTALTIGIKDEDIQEKYEWRHSIAGWDDAVNIEWLENYLAKMH